MPRALRERPCEECGETLRAAARLTRTHPGECAQRGRVRRTYSIATLVEGFGDYNTSGPSAATFFGLEGAMTNLAGNVGIGTVAPTITGTGKLHMAADTMRLDTARTPASQTTTCNVGEISWDTGYVYVCTATNHWRRTALNDTAW